MGKQTILCVDDDEGIQTVVGQYLNSDGYKYIGANDAASALECAQSSKPEVILLDLGLPDAEGLSLIPQLKSMGDVGIIVVSGKNDTTEKIICLEMGADDYLTKPFEMRELTARIKAVLRRMAPLKAPAQQESESVQNKSQAKKLGFGDGWCLDRDQYQLYDKNGDPADLTTGEFVLLEALMLSPNKVLSRERLFELTRDGEYDVYDRAIDIQIGRLRKKIDTADDTAEYIKTVRGVGYMFTEKVTAL